MWYTFGMVMPRRFHVKLVAYVPEEVRLEIRKEARTRSLSIGELIEEAFKTRVQLVRKPTRKEL